MNNARIPLSALLATTLLATAGASPGATLESVQGRGKLLCGVNTGLPGFSSVDQNGKWTGLDVDFCRAVAAATLGDADKVELKPLTAKERFTALQSGEIDLLSRNTTWTLSRDAAQGLSFTGVIYYDGQGFMVSKSLGVKSARELDGAAVCILAGTTTELNLADYFRTHDMKYEPVVFDTADQTSRGFETGRCDVLTSDQSQLYGLRIKLAEPDKAAVLPEVISKEPLGPAVRQGDDAWFNIVRWTLFALINAEELGVTADNVDAMKSSSNPEVRRLLGVEGSADSGLGLAPDWVAGVIKQVGNYGEIFQRNVGADSPLQIERGLNALWTDGGLQYAPPFR
jgi:general L-amino acid transport system substrate-binding protein